MTTRQEREALVLDFLRDLGYEPNRVREVVIQLDALTVRGYAVDDNGRKFCYPGTTDPALFEHTHPLWTTEEVAS